MAWALADKIARMENPRENDELMVSFYDFFFLPGCIYQFWAKLEAEDLWLTPGKYRYSGTEKPDKCFVVPVDGIEKMEAGGI